MSGAARVVEVYSVPSAGGYASQRTAAPGEVLRPILWGIDDSMLGSELGAKRAVGRPPANTGRSGGPGIAR